MTTRYTLPRIALVIRTKRRSPFLTVGWLWYLGTLVPVIGIVQVGAQSMADRYTYIPLIGLFVMISWGIQDLAARWRVRRVVLSVSAAEAAHNWGVILSNQGKTEEAVSHLRKAIRIKPDYAEAYNSFGVILAAQGKPEEAIAQYYQAIRAKANYAEAHNNLGVTLYKLGRFSEAITHYSEALRIDPDFHLAQHNLNPALQNVGRLTPQNMKN